MASRALIFSLLAEKDYESALKLVNANAKVANLLDDRGTSVLLYSLSNMPLSLAILKVAPKSAMIPDSKGNLPLHIASAISRIEVVMELLRLLPSSIVIANDLGHLPLHCAVRHHNEEQAAAIVDLLVSCDVDSARMKTKEGMAPIHFAALSGAGPDVINILQKAYPPGITEPELTLSRLPLHIAAANGAPPTCIRCLIDSYPLGLDMRDDQMQLPIAIAAQNCKDPKSLEAFLIAQPPSLKVTTSAEYGKLLDRAVNNGAPLGIVELIVKHIPDSPLVPNSSGELPIFTALQRHNVSIPTVRYLASVEPKCLAFPREKDGCYPIHVALEQCLPAAVIVVLTKYAPKSIRKPNNDKKLPIHYACWKGLSDDIITILLEVFPEGIWEKDGKYGMNALHYCAQYCSPLSIVKQIVDLDPNIIKEKNDAGRTALHLAAQSGASMDFVSFLFDSWPDSVTAMDNRGMTPVHYALERKNEMGAPGDVVRMLLNKRAEITEEALKVDESEAAISVAMSDFDRSAMEYELRCKQEETAKKARQKGIGNSASKFTSFVDLGSSLNMSSNPPGSSPDTKQISSLQQQIRAQAEEIRRLTNQSMNAANSIELSNLLVDARKQIKQFQEDNKELKLNLLCRDKEIDSLKEDKRIISEQLKSPEDIKRLQRAAKAGLASDHHKDELLRKLRNDVKFRDDQISEQTVKIAALQKQAKAQTVYTKEKEAEEAQARTRLEELMEELEQTKYNFQILKSGGGMMSSKFLKLKTTVAAAAAKSNEGDSN